MKLDVLSPCELLGDVIEVARTRVGQIDVYKCPIHGRCSQQFVRNTLRLCGRCSDFQSTTSHDGPILVSGEGGNVLQRHTEHDKMADDSNAQTNAFNAPSIALDVISLPLARLPISPVITPVDARLERKGRQPISAPIAPVRRAGRYSPRYTAAPQSNNQTHEQGRKQWRKPPSWAYGLTTVPERRKDLLPRTIQSLTSSGFDRPLLFVDGDWDYQSWKSEFGFEVVCRYPKIRTYGNWILALGELYIRNPDVDYYAIFQDDFVTSRNLRTYLESIHYPEKGYWNLYTFPHNQQLSNGRTGFYKASSSFRGTGALGLVFNIEAVKMLLSHNHMVSRASGVDRSRRHKFVDGAVVETMNQMGWSEYVHNPSLVQHIGLKSVSGNPNYPQQPLAPSFGGEEFDLMSLHEKEGVLHETKT